MTSSRLIVVASLLMVIVGADADASSERRALYLEQAKATRSPAARIDAQTVIAKTFSNGGFESGSFLGWVAGDNGVPAFQPWNVCSSCGWFGAQPFEGNFDATNGFDGAAGYTAFLYQDIAVPPGGLIASFWDRIRYDSLGISSTLPRIYEIQIQALDGSVLETVHHEEIVMDGAPFTDTGWRRRQLNLAAYGGQTVRVYIHLFAPETSTGPAQFEVDGFGMLQPDLALLDHMMLYRATALPGGDIHPFGHITLQDQFETRRWDVSRATGLALPANKNDEGVRDEETHLTEFKIKPVDPLFSFEQVDGVRILNQCNDLRVSVKRPVSLLVPSNKRLGDRPPPIEESDHILDHFLCYNAVAQDDFPKNIQVDVTDQFQTRRYDLKKITKLCNPVRKSGEPFFLRGPDKGKPFPITPAAIQHPTLHLTCYRARPAKRFVLQNGCGPATPLLSGQISPSQPPHQPVFGIHVENQFGGQSLRSVRELELCIPSWKNPVCGDGAVQAELGEACDDGNTEDGDGCTSTCVVEFCGDQINQPGIGEECDGTDDAACPGFCSSTCTCIDPCPHGVCETGGPLDPSCGACEAAVCAVDPFCCDVAWDSICVGEADVLCDNVCTPPYGSPTRAFLHPIQACLLD